MCAEEFATFLEKTRKAPFEEKLNSFGDIVEKIMSIILRIPDLVDESLNRVNQKISSLENRINAINNDVAAIKERGVVASNATVRIPAGPPPSPGALPAGPPPLPGGPPGGPPGRPATPATPAAPASPISLRGAIMGELKELFAKRQTK